MPALVRSATMAPQRWIRSMARRFIQVKRYRRKIGKQCMHCGRPATTTAIRNGAMRLNVWYCDQHAEWIIEQGLTRAPEVT